eukprot:194462-Rhodomonas_salina.4
MSKRKGHGGTFNQHQNGKSKWETLNRDLAVDEGFRIDNLPSLIVVPEELFNLIPAVPENQHYILYEEHCSSSSESDEHLRAMRAVPCEPSRKFYRPPAHRQCSSRSSALSSDRFCRSRRSSSASMFALSHAKAACGGDPLDG